MSAERGNGHGWSQRCDECIENLGMHLIARGWRMEAPCGFSSPNGQPSPDFLRLSLPPVAQAPTPFFTALSRHCPQRAGESGRIPAKPRCRCQPPGSASRCDADIEAQIEIVDAQPTDGYLQDRPTPHHRRDGDAHRLLLFDHPLLSAVSTRKEPLTPRPAADRTGREDRDSERCDTTPGCLSWREDDLNIEAFH